MTTTAKLAGFAATLALLSGGAALAGSATGPLRDRPAEREPGAMAMEAGAKMAPQAVRGLAVSEGGLTLELDRTTAAPGRRFDLGFRVVDRRGGIVRDFDVEHTKRMHLIVVRRDMTGFQHLHPTQRADGGWSVPIALQDAGSYRVFADFSTDGKARTLADDLTVDGAFRSRELPAPAPTATVDGLTVALA